MTIIIAFAVTGAITYFLRSSMLVAGNRFTSSPTVESAIGLVSPAVMAAIIASTLLVDHGRIMSPDLASVAAISVAIVAVRRTGNVGSALLVGLPIYWLIGLI
ncbi:AzlD domain-containing protein [Ilumatobacter sp.]|uniref:AzlD domain-containing protein n=1 Tax=Ilumatobacter sp. TaxID=1967498 RepID=UPI003C4A4B6E